MAAKRASKTDPARQWAIAAARLAEQRNCEEIIVLDLRDLSPVTDYFVIATGTSDRQLRSVGDELCQEGKAAGHRVWHVDGKDSGEWIVLDFVDVVVHLFDQAHRRHYDLELIWGEAPRVTWRPRARKTTDAET